MLALDTNWRATTWPKEERHARRRKSPAPRSTAARNCLSPRPWYLNLNGSCAGFTASLLETFAGCSTTCCRSVMSPSRTVRRSSPHWGICARDWILPTRCTMRRAEAAKPSSPSMPRVLRPRPAGSRLRRRCGWRRDLPVKLPAGPFVTSRKIIQSTQIDCSRLFRHNSSSIVTTKSHT